MPYRYRSRRQTRKSKFPFKLILGIIGVIVVVVGLFVFRGQLSNISLQSNQPNGSLVTSVKDYLADFVGPDKGVRQYIDSLLAGGSFTKSGDTNIVTQENPQTRVGKIAVISDSHASNETFDKVMSRIIAEEVDMVIHLGDVSKGGEISELEGIKDILDQSKIEY